jgi:hypothetical protein
MNFDATERSTLAGLADVLIPAADGFPSASEAGVSAEGFDQVLSFRPDLAAGLKKLLSSARGRVPGEFVAELRRDDPAAFGILAELVPGAYFLNVAVRAKLGYDGQTPKPIDPRPDARDDALLESVIRRGPVYRATPGRTEQ